MKVRSLEYELEELVDASSLGDVLRTLVDICHGKAEHLRSNWQDHESAKAWMHDAKLIGTAASKVINDI